MNKDTKIEELFGQEVLNYVKNKNRGGSSNAAGNIYENYFAVYQISLTAPEVIEQGKIINISSQILDFVDDLIIERITENLRCHYQLKNSQNINWGTGLKSISDDFNKQYILNNSVLKKSQVSLVVANLTLQNTMTSNMPAQIRSFSKVLHFPFIGSVNKLLEECTDFKEAIKYLSAFDEPEPDKMESVVKVLIGTWVTKDQKETNVMDILKKAQETVPSYIRSFNTNLPIQVKLQEILNQIPDFSYNLSKGFLQWQYGNGLMEGTLPYSIDSEKFGKFQEIIIRNNPTDFDEIEPFLI